MVEMMALLRETKSNKQEHRDRDWRFKVYEPANCGSIVEPAE